MRDINLENEREFENRKVLGDNPRSTQSKYYWTTEIERNKHLQSMKTGIVGKRVLEIGCSTGSLASELAPLVGLYVGTDISNEAIELANHRIIPNAKFQCADGHEIPYDDEYFDCVIVDALLHHLDLGKALEEIHRLLKPGGLLFFSSIAR